MRSVALSDFHLGRKSTRLAQPEAIEPLVAGFDRVLLLGDIIDQWYVSQAQFADFEGRLKETCRRAGVRELLWFSGNHDANNENAHEYAVFESVLYLHGHQIYHALRGTEPLKERIRALNHKKFGPHRWGSRSGKVSWDVIEHAYKRFPIRLLTPINWTWGLRLRIKRLVEEVEKTERLHAGAIRAVVFGHSHCPCVRRLSGMQVFNLGGWMKNTRACGFVHDTGRFRLAMIENGHHTLHWGETLSEMELTHGAKRANVHPAMPDA